MGSLLACALGGGQDANEFPPSPLAIWLAPRAQRHGTNILMLARARPRSRQEDRPARHLERPDSLTPAVISGHTAAAGFQHVCCECRI